MRRAAAAGVLTLGTQISLVALRMTIASLGMTIILACVALVFPAHRSVYKDHLCNPKRRGFYWKACCRALRAQRGTAERCATLRRWR